MYHKAVFLFLILAGVAGLAVGCNAPAVAPASATPEITALSQTSPPPVTATPLPIPSETALPSPSPTADVSALAVIGAGNAADIRALDAIRINSPLQALAVSADGKWLASGAEDGRVRVYSLADRRPVLHLTGHTRRIHALAFSPDSNLLASASEDYTVILWDIPSGKQNRKFEGHKSGVASLAFSTDGKLLASGSYDYSLRIWKATVEGAPRIMEQKRVFFNSLVFSPDDRDLYSAADNWREADFTIEVWKVVNGRLAHTWRGFKERINGLALSSDGRLLAAACGDEINNNDDENVKIIDTATGDVLRVFEGHTGPVYQTVFSPDGSLIASAGDDETIRLWNADDGQALAALTGHGGSIRGLAFTPDGKLILSASQDGSLRLWGVAP